MPLLSEAASFVPTNPGPVSDPATGSLDSGGSYTPEQTRGGPVKLTGNEPQTFDGGGGSGEIVAGEYNPNAPKQSPTDELPPIRQVPPIVGVSDPNPTLIPGGSRGGGGGGGGSGPYSPTVPEDPTLQDLYPENPGVVETPDVTVATPTSSGSVESDQSVTEVGDPALAGLTDDQMVDKDLARILEQGGPLLTRGRAEAAQYSNSRGLMNSSMAAGATMAAIVDRALPMAQQNAQQAFNRGLFNADQINQINKLEAELRSAMEMGDTQAANDALRQIDSLTRDAEGQQANISYSAGAETAAAQNAINSQIIDSVTRLNQQYLQGTQAMDLANVQGSWQSIIQTNETAGSFWNSGLQAIANIMSNPDMTPAQIASAIQEIVEMINGGLQMIATINDIDFGDLAPPETDEGGGTTPGEDQRDDRGG